MVNKDTDRKAPTGFATREWEQKEGRRDGSVKGGLLWNRMALGHVLSRQLFSVTGASYILRTARADQNSTMRAGALVHVA
jgi:hypothetical protein